MVAKKPTRMSTADVADRLGMSETTIRTFAKVGYLAGQTSSGERGRGQRYYFDPAEVEAFAAGGAPAAAAYREAQASARQAGPTIKPRRRSAGGV